MAVSNSTTVTTIYESLAGGMAPPAADLATYTALMNSAGWTPAMVTTAIEAEPFIQNVVNPIIREYQAAFGRVPDQAGLSFWVKQYAALDPTNAPLTVAQLGTLSTTFTGAAEFTSRYGSTWTPTTLITPANGSALVSALYTNILGRSPDPAGLSYWLNAKVTVSQLLASFTQAAEFITDTNASITVFENLEAQGTPATTGSLLGLVPPVITNIALTTGIDTLSISTNNTTVVGTFNGNAGAPSTFTAGDSIIAANGLTGVSLTLSDQGTATTTYVGNLGGVAATVSGVSTVSVFSGESVYVNTQTSIAGFAGLTQLNITSAVDSHNEDQLYVGAATNVTVTDLGTTTNEGIYIYGGHNVTVNESGHVEEIYVGGDDHTVTTTTVPTGAVTVNVTGTGSTEVYINGGTTVAVSSSQTGDITIGGTIAPAGAVTVNATNDGGIYIYGGASAAVTQTAGLAAGDFSTGDVYVKGVAGAVTVNQTAISSGSITAGGSSSLTINTTGNLNGEIRAGEIYGGGFHVVPVAGNVAITDTFAGPDNQSIYAYATGSVSITTARNSNDIRVGNSTVANDPTGAVTIVNETGTKFGTGTTDVYLNGSTAVSITGGGSTFVEDVAATQSLKTVSLTGLQNGATIDGNAVTTLNLSTSKQNVLLNNSTALHSLTVNVTGEGSSSTSPVITDNNATTISLVATGAANFVDIGDSVAAGATAFNVSNTGTGTLWVTGGNFGGAAGEVVTVSGTGAVNLGTLGANASVKSITTTDTAGVTVTINDGVTFNGGTTGNNVVTDNGNTGGLTSIVNGGTGGNNTLIMDAPSANYDAAPGLGITNFNILEVSTGGTGAFDGTIFTALIDNAGAGITFNNIAAGAPVTLMSNQALQANTQAGVTALSFNVGIAGSSILAPTAYSNTVTVNTANAGVTTLNLNPVSQYGSTSTQTLTIVDATPLAGTPVTTINVTGSGVLTLHYSTTTVGVASALATINASGSAAKLDVSAVIGATTGLTVTGGTGALTAFGSGLAAGETASSFIGASDSFTSGSGGAKITLGYAASTTVNLAASTAKGDTITVGHLLQNSLTVPQINATVNGFQVTASSTTSDSLKFTDTVTLLATNATVLGTTAYGGSDTYTVANGMIVFSGSDAFGQLAQDAEGIVLAAGANEVAAFTANGNTYVFDSSNSNTGVFGFVSLAGVTATQFDAATAAAGAILSNTGATVVLTGATGAAIVTGASTITQNDTGYIVQAISGTGTAAVTVNNLAPSAIVNDSATGNFALTTTQTGTAGSESLTLNISGAQVMPVLTVTGDNALTINATATSTVTSLVDPGNTLASLSISGSAAFTLTGFTDTALTKISVSDTNGVTLGTLAAPLAKASLAVSIGSSTTPTNSATDHVYLSGATNTVTAFDTSGSLVVSATGAGSSVTLTGTGNAFGSGQHITVGATGTVTLYQGTAAAAGVLANNGGGDNAIYVGTNSTVTLSTDHSGNATDGGSLISVAGDVTGANSAGTYAMTTINNAVSNVGEDIQFSTASPSRNAVGFVNVAVATSLANALDVAAHYISFGANSGEVSAGWFQYGGNTYVLAHTGGTEAVMSSSDSLVKLTGIVDLNMGYGGHGGDFTI